MRLPSLLITSVLAVGLAVPAMAQQSSTASRSATAVPFNPGNGYGVGSLAYVCRPQCGFPSIVIGFAPPEIRKCVAKCIAAKKAAQH